MYGSSKYFEMSKLIEVYGLEKSYSRGTVQIPALGGISLGITPGEFMAILGASGSGKSTFLNILGCLDRPTKGTYLFKDRNIESLSYTQLAHIRNKYIGFIFQGFNLLPRATALENVELPLLYNSGPISGKRRKDMSLAILKNVGLEGREYHLPNQLSGGEQQRVAIARALINEPEIILADEPTGNLDSQTSLEIMGIFQRLNQEKGITVVLVTHEADIAAFSRRRVYFRDGQIVKDETITP
jgi:putative ABC transport system ATP-binding protein